jgi:hypothetical protein
VIALRQWRGSTHADFRLTPTRLNHDNVAKQRQLNAKGEASAKTSGEA